MACVCHITHDAVMTKKIASRGMRYSTEDCSCGMHPPRSKSGPLEAFRNDDTAFAFLDNKVMKWMRLLGWLVRHNRVYCHKSCLSEASATSPLVNTAVFLKQIPT
jgi:hypothetical protein